MSSIRMGARPGAKALAVPAVAGLLLVLAACGGGSSTGGLQPPTIQPTVCTATVGGGDGFALGVCASNTGVTTSAFQPVAASVSLMQTDYDLDLMLSNVFSDPSLRFGPDQQTDFGVRDVIGVLRGAAFERDADGISGESLGDLDAPYTALADFRKAWSYNVKIGDLVDANAELIMTYAGFGIWERFAQPTTENGYLGVWYSAMPESDATNERPTTPREYTGVAVGILGPAEAGAAYSGLVGFSATVTVSVNASNGITSGMISNLTITRRILNDPSTVADDELVPESVPVNDLSFVPASISNDPGQPQRGELRTFAGAGALATGRFEASYFGSGSSPSEEGREIAGRFRFQTSDGSLIGVGSFGARAP